jgi:hypothetical protein
MKVWAKRTLYFNLLAELNNFVDVFTAEGLLDDNNIALVNQYRTM